MSKEMTYQGRVVAVVEVNGGWTTILDGMKQIKVRNGELSAVRESKMPDQPKPPRDRPSRTAALAKHDAELKASKDQDPPLELDGQPPTQRAVDPNMARYTTHEVRTTSGRRAVDTADATADALRGLDLEGVYLVASQTLGIPVESLKKMYGHLNPGMQRMNMGNRMRKATRLTAES